MNTYIEQLKQSSRFNNLNFIEGLEEGLDASSLIADDMKLRLAGIKAFDELYDFVLAHSNKLSENKK